MLTHMNTHMHTHRQKIFEVSNGTLSINTTCTHKYVHVDQVTDNYLPSVSHSLAQPKVFDNVTPCNSACLHSCTKAIRCLHVNNVVKVWLSAFCYLLTLTSWSLSFPQPFHSTPGMGLVDIIFVCLSWRRQHKYTVTHVPLTLTPQCLVPVVLWIAID